MRILVVEDDRRMAKLLERGLSEEGYQVFVAHDGHQGFAIARSSGFDAIVLDVMLPGLDGIALARQLREAGDKTPMLILTAKDTAADTIAGLDAGADDYLVKPFPFDVLLARLRALCRRGDIPRPVWLEVADLKLDPATRRVTRGQQEIDLTPRELALLELLMRNHDRVVTKDTLIESVWGYDSDISGNTVEAFVHLLRLKVDANRSRLIHTVRGVGYVMRQS